jgi:hypothetical protein
MRRHGGGGVAGHRGSDRLWIGRGRHDRHVLRIVDDEFGELDVVRYRLTLIRCWSTSKRHRSSWWLDDVAPDVVAVPVLDVVQGLPDPAAATEAQQNA